MRRLSFVVLGLGLSFGLLLFAMDGKAQMGRGMMGGGMMGGGMMGSGRMGDAGPGMMNQGYGDQYGPQYQRRQMPLREEDARTILEDYLKSTRNPNLKLGRIGDRGYAFEAEILTRNDSLVDKILVEKNTGSMRSVY
jgi:hypothetical protein